jgi:ribose/xylose/arabinose/galactoside ABC-type transport system permease subunit
MGGEASASGCFVAAIVLAAINDALIVLNINTNAVELAEGLLIFVAVLAGRLGHLVLRREQTTRRDGGRTKPSAGTPAASAAGQ